MSLTAAPYPSLSSLPPLSPIQTLSPAKRRTLHASTALATLQSLPIQLDLLIDPSPQSTPYFGLYVSHVTRGSTAWEGGLRRGDVVLEVARRRTVVVSDIAEALRGLIAGDVVSVVVERAGEELELQVMIAAKGMNKEEVRALYKVLAEEIAAHDDALKANPATAHLPSASSLSLSDILACPPFAASLLSYMQSTLSAECLLFLHAEQAYQRIPLSEPHRLHTAAQRLYDTFIDDDATQPVNIRGEGKRAIGERIVVGAVTQLLFHSVAQEVYGVVEADVLPRYFQSSYFQSLVSSLTTPAKLAALCSSTMGLPRRRSNSFSSPPCEERRAELEDIRSAFLASTPSPIALHKRGHGLGKRAYKGFEGRQLVAWLMREGVVEWEVGGWAIGQRLMDSLLLWRCDDGAVAHGGAGGECDEERRRTEFVGDDKLYTFAVPEVDGGRDDDDVCDTGYVLLKGGVMYTRLWLHCHRKRKRLSLYRDEHSTDTLYRACLKGATLSVYGLPSPSHTHGHVRGASITLSPPSHTSSLRTPPLSASPSSSPTSSPTITSTPSPTPSRFSSSRGAVAPHTPPPSPLTIGSTTATSATEGGRGEGQPSFVACYLRLCVRDSASKRRELVLRADDREDAAAWVQLFSELGVHVKYCTSEEGKQQQTSTMGKEHMLAGY